MQADRRSANLRKGVAESSVLAAMRQEEVDGVDLARRPVGTGLPAGEGSLSPMLARPRTSGLVTTRWADSPAGPPRRCYRLTAAGERAVAEFDTTWRRCSGAVTEILEETE